MQNTTKLPIHTVLFATDLSDGSSVALSYAARIASTYGAKLLLVHVLDPAGAANPMESSPSDLGKLAQSAKLALQQVSQGVLTAQGIKGEILVRYGNVRDMIFQVKREYSADIVVLGSSGRKIGRGKALGSAAEAILRSLPCSVLTIGPNVEQRLLSAKAQAVLFPTNFSPASLAAIPMAISLVADLSASLLLLHVCDPYESHSCFGHEATCRKRMREIAESAEKQTTRVEQFLRQGRIAEHILSFAKEKGVAFIVMGVDHGDLEDGTRLHGIVSDIVREAHCPVLTVAHQAEHV
jgi:universal stress protein A